MNQLFIEVPKHLGFGFEVLPWWSRRSGYGLHSQRSIQWGVADCYHQNWESSLHDGILAEYPIAETLGRHDSVFPLYFFNDVFSNILNTCINHVSYITIVVKIRHQCKYIRITIITLNHIHHTKAPIVWPWTCTCIKIATIEIKTDSEAKDCERWTPSPCKMPLGDTVCLASHAKTPRARRETRWPRPAGQTWTWLNTKNWGCIQLDFNTILSIDYRL